MPVKVDKTVNDYIYCAVSYSLKRHPTISEETPHSAEKNLQNFILKAKIQRKTFTEEKRNTFTVIFFN